MKNKLFTLLGVAACVLAADLITGCAGTPAQKQAATTFGVQLAAQTVVSGDLTVRPQDLPDIQAAQAAICAVGNSSNSIPGQVSAALYDLNIGGKVGTIAQANLTGLLQLIAMEEAADTNSASISLFANAVCTGIGNGITLAQSSVAPPPK